MKILHVAYFGMDGKLNGVSEAVMKLASAQKELGPEVKICITTRHSIIDEKFIHHTPSLDNFKKVVESFSPDIISFHSLYEFQQITFSHYLRNRKIPYVLVFHGGASSDNAKKNWLKKKIANFVFWNYFIHKAKRVIYLSKNEESKSVFRKINKNSVVIGNGTDYPTELPCPSANEKLNIAFIGRLDYWGKGLDLLFAAIRKLQDDGWKDRLHFTFYGAQYDDTPDKIKALDPMAHWLGFVSGKEKEHAYQNSDILILPSRSEGMPMCVLEALSYGVPCMVTPETNMADVIENGHCGWVINLNVQNIVDTIKSAYADIMHNKAILFENSRKVSEAYSWPNLAKLSIETYKEVLS